MKIVFVERDTLKQESSMEDCVRRARHVKTRKLNGRDYIKRLLLYQESFCFKQRRIQYMTQNNQFIILSDRFFATYPSAEFPEIEQKPDRPYVQIRITVDGVDFAAPLRSHIRHPFAFLTDEENKCGVDFSKVIVLKEDWYIDSTQSPRIRQNEFDALRNSERVLSLELKKYIRSYKRAKRNIESLQNAKIVQYSTLQYFENEIENI